MPYSTLFHSSDGAQLFVWWRRDPGYKCTWVETDLLQEGLFNSTLECKTDTSSELNQHNLHAVPFVNDE